MTRQYRRETVELLIDVLNVMKKNSIVNKSDISTIAKISNNETNKILKNLLDRTIISEKDEEKARSGRTCKTYKLTFEGYIFLDKLVNIMQEIERLNIRRMKEK